MNFAINNNAATNAANVLRPAQAALIEAGLAAAWDIYQMPDGQGGQEATIVRDMVWRMEQGRSLSEKQVNYLRVLVDRIANRGQRAAQWAAEAQDAAPVPTGRLTFTGTILTVKGQETRFGYVTKLLVKTSDGWKAWGTCPRSIDANKGDTITMTASVEPSPNDAKFGFYSRPTGARIVRAAQGNEQ